MRHLRLGALGRVTRPHRRRANPGQRHHRRPLETLGMPASIAASGRPGANGKVGNIRRTRPNAHLATSGGYVHDRRRRPSMTPCPSNPILAAISRYLKTRVTLSSVAASPQVRSPLRVAAAFLAAHVGRLRPASLRRRPPARSSALSQAPQGLSATPARIVQPPAQPIAQQRPGFEQDVIGHHGTIAPRKNVFGDIRSLDSPGSKIADRHVERRSRATTRRMYSAKETPNSPARCRAAGAIPGRV